FFPYSSNLKNRVDIEADIQNVSAWELDLKQIVQAMFHRFSSTSPFTKSWINKFLCEKFIKCNEL
ncbi:MAG: hypothetical protein QXZ17_15455, partial [Nitrososphaerota archaeon]